MTETHHEHLWNDSAYHYSDWRNVLKADYASNPIVYRYYKKEPIAVFRNESIVKISKRLIEGDTIRIALDYYALFPDICTTPIDAIRKWGNRLAEGEVIVFEIYVIPEKGTVWKEIKL